MDTPPARRCRGGVHLGSPTARRIEMLRGRQGFTSISPSAASCAASTRIRAPTACAFRAADESAGRSRDVRGATHGEHATRAPYSATAGPCRPHPTPIARDPTLTTCARRRHGRSLEWCSITVESTTWCGSNGYRNASLLIASVVFFPKMTAAVCGSARGSARSSRVPLRRRRCSGET